MISIFSAHTRTTKCGSALNSTIVSIYCTLYLSISCSSYSGPTKCCCLRIIGLRILCVHDIIYSIIISYHLPIWFFFFFFHFVLCSFIRSVTFSIFLFQASCCCSMGLFFPFISFPSVQFVRTLRELCEYVLSLACKFIRSFGWLTFVLGVVAHEANVLPLNSSKIYVSFTFVPIYGQITSSLCTCLHCLNKF